MEDRECWVYYHNQRNIGALLIYKIEETPINSLPSLPQKRRIKICTFKVESIGYRIGELFIKCIVRIALEEKSSEIYLTHFTEKDDRLIKLISEYGFFKVAILERENGNEDVYLKNIYLNQANIDELTPIEIAKIFYPSFDDRENIKKFLIPIRPEYHKKLFIDCPIKISESKNVYQTTFDEFMDIITEIEPTVEGNSITKAYICHSNNRKIRAGDIILFYRSQDIKSLTALGVVESVKVGLEDFNEIYRIVRKRTACKEKQIEKIAEKPTTVILFTHQTYFENAVDIKYLESIGLSSPMSITEITHEDYKKIKEYGKIDGRLTIN